MSSETPSGWQTARIGDKFSFTTKPKGISLHEAKIPFLPMNRLPSDSLHVSDFEMRNLSEISSATYFEEGDLLVSKITPCFENGKQGIAINVPKGYGYATTEVIPIKEINGISHLPFLAMYLLHADVRNRLAEKMEGATGRQRLPKHALENWIMPIPPLPEQREIAIILSKIQVAIKMHGGIVAALKELKTAIMTKLFREGLSGEPLKQSELGKIPKSWEVVKLGQVCRIASGGTPARDNPQFWNGNIPWVKTGEINYRRIKETEEHITEKGLENSAAKVFPRDTVLMAMYGQGVTRGRVAILDIAAATNQACAALIPDATLDSEFLYSYCEFAYDRIRDLGHGANQKNLSLDILKGLFIPRPKMLDKQRRVASVSRKLNEAIAIQERRQLQLKNLFSSALHSLMTGETRIPAEFRRS